jgi:hypothetical protein
MTNKNLSVIIWPVEGQWFEVSRQRCSALLLLWKQAWGVAGVYSPYKRFARAAGRSPGVGSPGQAGDGFTAHQGPTLRRTAPRLFSQAPASGSAKITTTDVGLTRSRPAKVAPKGRKPAVNHDFRQSEVSPGRVPNTFVLGTRKSTERI